MNGIMMNGMKNKKIHKFAQNVTTSAHTSTILNHVHTENNHSCTVFNHVCTVDNYSCTLHFTQIREHCHACPSDVSTGIYGALSSFGRAYTCTRLRCLQASHLDFSCKRLHALSHLEDGHTCYCNTDTGTASPCEHSGVYLTAPWSGTS